MSLPDMGPVGAFNVDHFFAQEHNRQVIERLIALGIHWPKVEKRK